MTPTKKIWRATSRRYLHELLRKFVSWFITISIVCGLNMGGKGYNLRTIFLLAKMGQILRVNPFWRVRNSTKIASSTTRIQTTHN